MVNKDEYIATILAVTSFCVWLSFDYRPTYYGFSLNSESRRWR